MPQWAKDPKIAQVLALSNALSLCSPAFPLRCVSASCLYNLCSECVLLLGRTTPLGRSWCYGCGDFGLQAVAGGDLCRSFLADSRRFNAQCERIASRTRLVGQCAQEAAQGEEEGGRSDLRLLNASYILCFPVCRIFEEYLQSTNFRGRAHTDSLPALEREASHPIERTPFSLSISESLSLRISLRISLSESLSLSLSRSVAPQQHTLISFTYYTNPSPLPECSRGSLLRRSKTDHPVATRGSTPSPLLPVHECNYQMPPF